MEKQQLEPIPSRKSETPMSWGSTCRTFPSSVSGLSGMGIQAQLETTAPGDIYEQEADRMADYVVGVSSKPESPVSGMSRPSVSAFGGTSVALPSSLGSRIGEVRGRGDKMPSEVLSRMQNGFGRDFSQVRIHTDEASAEMNRSIGALAFTYGNDIFFNAGQFQPETAAGQHLIAHELTHTLQQSGKVARETDQQANDDSDSLQAAALIVSCLNSIIDTVKYSKDYAKAREICIQAREILSKAYFTEAQDIEKVTKGISKSITDIHFRSQIAVEAPQGRLMSRFSMSSWAISVAGSVASLIPVLQRAIRSNEGADYFEASYLFVRTLTTLVDWPFPVKLPAPALAVIKAWNAGCTVGDLIYLGLEATGINELRLKEMQYTASVYGGAGTTGGDVAAAITSVPIVGEVFAGLTWVGDSIGKFLFD